ncbi:MAG: hypothetical protein AAFV88_09140 [Planctomycetota bacterium]
MPKNDKLKSKLRANAKRRKQRHETHRARATESPVQSPVQSSSNATAEAGPDVAGLLIESCLEFDTLQGNIRDQDVLAAFRGLTNGRSPESKRATELIAHLQDRCDSQGVAESDMRDCANAVYKIAREQVNEDNPHSLLQYFQLMT